MKKYMEKVVLTTLIVLASPSLFADSDISYSWTPKFISYQVSDPDGSTETASDFQFLSGSLTYKLSRQTRIVSEGSYYDFELSAGVSKIGQEVKTISLATYYETELKWGRNFKPWAGIGLAINMDEFTKRHTIDSDGFLSTRYEDRSDTNFSLAVRISNSWDISRDMGMSVNIGYQIPLTDTIEGLEFGVSLNF